MSYQTWRDVFGSDPDIIGKPIRVGSGPLNVIGVAAEGFEFPVGTAMWTKVFTGPPGQPLQLYNQSGYVRAQPGVSLAQVQAQLDVFAARIETWPDGRKLEFVARPLLEDVVGDLRPTLLIVSGATALLLLIACINVANLLLARGVVRSSEFALREAMGARRWRMFRQLMTESFVLCTLGGVLGLGLALGAIQLLKAVGPADLPRFCYAVDRRQRVSVRGRVRLARGVRRGARACAARVARRLERFDQHGRTLGGHGAGPEPHLRCVGDRRDRVGRRARDRRGPARAQLFAARVRRSGLRSAAHGDAGAERHGAHRRPEHEIRSGTAGRRLRRNRHVGGGAVLPGAHTPHRRAAGRRLCGRSVRRAAEPRVVPRRSLAQPRRRQQRSRHRSARVRLPGFARVLHDARHPAARGPVARADRSARRGGRHRRQRNVRARVSRWAESRRPPYRAAGRKLASGVAWVRSGRRANRRRGRDRRRDSGHQAGQPPGRRAAGGLPTARATDHAQDGDRRPLGDRRSRRADSGDSPRARGDGLHDSRRVRRLLGRRRRVAGAAQARSRRARRVRPRVADAGRGRNVRPDVVLGQSAVQRDRRAIGVRRRARQSAEDVRHARAATGGHRHRFRCRRRDRDAAGRREPAL